MPLFALMLLVCCPLTYHAGSFNSIKPNWAQTDHVHEQHGVCCHDLHAANHDQLLHFQDGCVATNYIDKNNIALCNDLTQGILDFPIYMEGASNRTSGKGMLCRRRYVMEVSERILRGGRKGRRIRTLSSQCLVSAS